MTVISVVDGCASLPSGPNDGPNGRQPPPQGDVGTYMLDAARTLTISGHQFQISQSSPGVPENYQFAADATLIS